VAIRLPAHARRPSILQGLNTVMAAPAPTASDEITHERVTTPEGSPDRLKLPTVPDDPVIFAVRSCLPDMAFELDLVPESETRRSYRPALVLV